MLERIRRTQSETFEITVRGLLNKRSDLFAEAEKVQGQLNSLRDDIEAVDRILDVLRYQADPEASMPSAKRLQTPFRHGALGRMIFDTLRTAPEPITTRRMAEITCEHAARTQPTRSSPRTASSASPRPCGTFRSKGAHRHAA